VAQPSTGRGPAKVADAHGSSACSRGGGHYGGLRLRGGRGRRPKPRHRPGSAAGRSRLRSNDGVCGSRLELWDNDKIYSLLLDGPDNFRVLDITEQSKHASGGCSIGFKIPGYPPTEDSTGVESAQVRSGWDRQDNRCARYTVIDGRRWILDSPSLSGFLLHGEGRILAGDPRCGDPAPFRPWGEPDCGEKKWDVVRGWCSWPELVPDGQRGQAGTQLTHPRTSNRPLSYWAGSRGRRNTLDLGGCGDRVVFGGLCSVWGSASKAG
jgi:hypothetical protein